VAATPEDWQRVFGENVIGYANMVRECLPELRNPRSFRTTPRKPRRRS
jgi:NAD(P)-dependent dehydrogenase (short-subunit alcohol dehydrogenase family)